MSTTQGKRTATAALIYWLLVVCGLGGITVLRIDALDEVAALWIGSLSGIGLAQLVARLRVRAWVLASFGMVMAWLSPIFFFMLYREIRPAAELGLFAFLPAFVCSYLALSERWGVVSFWYPAVLWMLVVLDGPGSFSARASLPLLVGMGIGFVAFLRARETRRVALWQAHGLTRLAKPIARNVLRRDPLRAASAHVWNALVGGCTLVLAAWIAPHLWQKEHQKRSVEQAAHAAALSNAYAAEAGVTPCCASQDEVEQSHAREYFTLKNSQVEDERRQLAMTCTVCDGYASGNGGNGGTSSWRSAGSGGYSSNDPTPSTQGWRYTSPTPYAYQPPTMVTPQGGTPTPYGAPDPVTPVPLVPTPAAQPLVRAPAQTTPVLPGTPARRGAAPATTPFATPAAQLHGGPPTIPAYAKPTAEAPIDESLPWKSAVALFFGGAALMLVARGIRRQVRLRHLVRPFWKESIDQRISNHWERALIGLRDAGIEPTDDEQPQALAVRVQRLGIPGLEVCATILERVRHGVRVEAGDLEAMSDAASAVYDAARKRAGIAGRTAALLS